MYVFNFLPWRTLKYLPHRFMSLIDCFCQGALDWSCWSQCQQTCSAGVNAILYEGSCACRSINNAVLQRKAQSSSQWWDEVVSVETGTVCQKKVPCPYENAPWNKSCDVCVLVVIMEDEKNATCETFWVKLVTRITLKRVNNFERKKKSAFLRVLSSVSPRNS